MRAAIQMLLAAEAHAGNERDRGNNRASDDRGDGTGNDGGDLFETHIRPPGTQGAGAAEQQ